MTARSKRHVTKGDLYILKLHNTIFDESLCKTIIRVPGGYIYQDYDVDLDHHNMPGVFVPFYKK